MGPPIQIFLTSIASAPALRQRQEHLLRILQVKKIPFTSYDLASDEDAKKLWRRKAPTNNANLPGIIIGGEFAGTYAEFDEAVEFGELDQFFRLKEAWGEEDEALAPAPAPQKPIGVPGVATPLQVTGQRPSFSPSPSKPPKKSSGKSVDLGAELAGFGLEGLKVSEEEMLELVESLGLGGDDADDLVKGLGLSSKPQPLKAKLEAAATAPNTSSPSQTTTKVPEATNNDATVAESSVATTAAPSSPSATPGAQVDKASSGGGIASATEDPMSGPTTGSTGPVSEAAAASTKPESTPIVKVEDVERLDDGSSPKDAQPNAPSLAPAVAPSDGHLPSATDGEKNTAPPALATAGSSAQDESQTKESSA